MRSLHKRRRLLKNRFLWHKHQNRYAEAGENDFVLILDHLKPSYNIGKIFRSAYAMACREVHLISIPYFDPYPAKGALKYVPAKFFATHEESLSKLQVEGYSIFALDAGAKQCFGKIELPQKSAFWLGSEGKGITFNYKSLDFVSPISIQQFGKMESLNVSVAASIAMYEYVRQHAML